MVNLKYGNKGVIKGAFRTPANIKDGPFWGNS